MQKFKICMVGSYAVGKTSLVERYVHSIYSEKYQTTIGVKIDKKAVCCPAGEASCIIWDIAGEDDFYTVNASYLRGMAGYFLVLDGTRAITLDIALRIQSRIEGIYEGIPFVLIVNKSDLLEQWEITQADLEPLANVATAVINTSARTGDHVEHAFETLVSTMFGNTTFGSTR